jgi:hypothetical protein
MADVSIANLPAFVGANPDPGDLLVFVRVSDSTESPLGTTRRLSVSQAFANMQISGPLTITGDLNLPGGGLGITNGTTRFLSVASGGAPALTWNTTAFVIGTDPGSTSYLLRVGGGLQLAETTGNSAQFSTSFSGIGPILRLSRSAATARTWQLRLNAAAQLELMDETAGAVRLTVDVNGALVVGTDPGGSELIRSSTARHGTLQITTVVNLADNTQLQWGGSAGDAILGNSSTHVISIYTGNAMRLQIGATGLLTIPAYGFGGGSVSAGAADSGGTGFRVLRVPN